MFTTTAIPSVRRWPLFAAEQDKWLEGPDTFGGAVDDMTHILCCPPVLLGNGRLPPRTSSCFGGTRSLPLRCLSRGQKNHLGARILTHRTFHRTLQSLCEIHSKHNFAKANENAPRAPSLHPTVGQSAGRLRRLGFWNIVSWHFRGAQWNDLVGI